MTTSDLFDISGSIVSYQNDPEQLASAARSFLQSSLRVGLTIVDNSPTDTLRTKGIETGADYYFNSKNVGFGAAHNIAIRKYLLNSHYHLILNPDVHFDPTVLVHLYNFMQANPKIGMVMPRILYPGGEEQHLCKLLPRPIDLIARRFGGRLEGTLFRSMIDRYLLRGIEFDGPKRVPSLSGCFMLIRTKVLRQVGLFDERYFMYMEDVDLCRRIGQVSSTVFYPGVAIFHEYAKGSYNSNRLLLYHVKSAWRYFCKWGWFRDEARDYLNKRLWDPAESEFVCDFQPDEMRALDEMPPT